MLAFVGTVPLSIGYLCGRVDLKRSWTPYVVGVVINFVRFVAFNLALIYMRIWDGETRDISRYLPLVSVELLLGVFGTSLGIRAREDALLAKHN